MNYYDLYTLGRLIKRLYFEGTGLFFKNRKNIDLSNKNLLRDCEIINNKAYELCQKLKLNHLDVYWEQIFNQIETNNIDNPKEFGEYLNSIYKMIDISILDSIFGEELKFYKLGTFLSNSWIYMHASKSFSMEDELKAITITEEIKFKYKELNIILEEILTCIHNANIDDFNKKTDDLINEIKKIENLKHTNNIQNNRLADVEYDLFISHASEDKEDFVEPLVEELKKLGINVWYDQFTLKVGDSLREKIDEGLKKSRYGTVIISTSFIQKSWTGYELNSMITKEMNGHKMILPIWHKVTKNEVLDFSLALADKVALNTSIQSIDEIAKRLVEVIKS